MLNTRFGCDAKVRKVLASAAEGAVKVKSLLLTYIPSPVVRGPPRKARLVLVATSELQPLASVVVQVPEGKADGSLLNMTLLSEAVTVPVDPVSSVLITVAEAFEAKSKLANAMVDADLPSVNRLILISIKFLRIPDWRWSPIGSSRRIMTAMKSSVQSHARHVQRKGTMYRPWTKGPVSKSIAAGAGWLPSALETASGPL
jgi:hypothetical protein